jgi:hypothetical protein
MEINIYKSLQKTSFFILFEVFDGRYREKDHFDWILDGFSGPLKYSESKLVRSPSRT